jgi:hypothetical protein
VSAGANHKFIRENMIAVARSGGNGWFVMTADGKVLKDFRYTPEGLAAFRKLPEEERRPKRIEPITVNPPGLYHSIVDTRWPPPPPETLVLRAHTRALDRDAQGRLVRAEQDGKGRKPFAWATGPARDWLWLTEAEWRSLVPERPAGGMTFPVPRPIAFRTFRFYLDDSCQGAHWFWEAQHVRSGGLTLRVEEVSAGAVRLRLDGAAALSTGTAPRESRRCEAKFLGFLDYDRNRKVFSRFDVVAVVGEYRVPESYRPDLSHAWALGVAFDLATPETAGYGAPPYALYRRCETGYSKARQTDRYLPLGHPELRPYFEADR